MDRAALSLIEILDDNTERYDLQTKLVCFEKGQGWLIRRAKLRPSADETEGGGIADMRAWMENPATRDMLKKSLFEIGVVIEPERKPGRPDKAQAAVRARFESYKAAVKEAQAGEDDSGWKKLGVGGNT